MGTRVRHNERLEVGHPISSYRKYQEESEGKQECYVGRSQHVTFLTPLIPNLRIRIWNTVKMKRLPTAPNFSRYLQTYQLPFSNTIGTVNT